LVIEVEIVNIVPLALTYGVAEVVALGLKAAMQDHFSVHHRALQVELAEPIALTAQTGTGQGVAEAALGAEVVVAMAVMVVVVVAQAVLAALVVLDLMPVLTDKISLQIKLIL
jgi:hypothetical protein